MVLKDKVVIVTGASRGIGLAIAATLAASKARVFGVARAWPERPNLSTDIHPILGDVRKPSDVSRVVKGILKEVGTIDVLVNNAGVEYFKPLVDTNDEEYDEILDTNLRGAFLFTRAVLPTFLASRSGHIVFVNSVSGLRGYSKDAAYCASKHGLAGLADALDEELRPHGVRVTSIFPGATDTDLSADTWAPADDLRRPYFLAPADVAQAVAFALEQPPRVAVSRIVLRPMIEPPYSDFLPLDLVMEFTRGSRDPTEA
jgi:NADP-dependent 3-hydroxy acid dehydrogenase YdfG